MRFIFIYLLLLLVFQVHGQEEERFPSNEFKITSEKWVGAVKPLAFAYEKVLNNKKGGVGLVVSVFDRRTTDYLVEVAPYYRYFTGIGIASGIFFEGSTFLRSGDYIDAGITVGSGFKWVSKKGGFLFEFFARVGPWTGSDYEWDSNLVNRVGVSVGVRL